MFPSFSVYTSPFISIFQSFSPCFSDLPPAAYVYVRLRFVLKFQFKVLIFDSISGNSKIPSYHMFLYISKSTNLLIKLFPTD